MKKELILISLAAIGGTVIYFFELNRRISNENSPQVMDSIVASIDENIELITQAPVEKVPSNVICQFYLFDADETISVIGKEGTQIHIERQDLQFEDGTAPSGEIKIALKECYDLSDMIIENLSTTNYDKILETAGMVHLEAFSEGKKLQLKEGKSYQVAFPRKSSKEDFQLFYGVKEGGKAMQWELAEQPATPLKQDEVSEDESEQKCFIKIRDSYVIRNTKVHLQDHYNWQLETGNSLQSWFLSSFNPTLEMIDAFCTFHYETQVHLKIDEEGKIKERYLMKSSTPECDLAILQQLDQMPDFDMQEFMPKYDEDHRIVLLISSGKLTSSETTIRALEKKYDDDKDMQKQPGISGISKSDLFYYVFNAAEMGWLNCDRFYETEEKTDFLVHCERPMDSQVSLSFENFQGLLAGTPTSEGVQFVGIPKGEKVKVITIQHGTQPMMSVAQANTNEGHFIVSKMKPFKLRELRGEL